MGCKLGAQCAPRVLTKRPSIPSGITRDNVHKRTLFMRESEGAYMANCDESSLLFCIGMCHEVHLLKVNGAVLHHGLDPIANLKLIHAYDAAILHIKSLLPTDMRSVELVMEPCK